MRRFGGNIPPFIRLCGDFLPKAQQSEQPNCVAGANGTGVQAIIKGDVGSGDLFLKMKQSIALLQQFAQLSVMRRRDTQAVVLRQILQQNAGGGDAFHRIGAARTSSTMQSTRSPRCAARQMRRIALISVTK